MNDWQKLIFFGGLLILFSSCFFVNSLLYQSPDFKDSNRFPRSIIENGPRSFSFIKQNINYGEKLIVDDYTFNGVDRRKLNELFLFHKTKSFLLIRNDTILFEQYLNDATVDTKMPSFSISKSFVSALLGIAIDEKKIKLQDKIVDYIPELLRIDSSFSKLYVENLLHHTSGIKGSIILDGKIYYGNDIFKALKDIKLQYEPGKHQEYLNINTQLLGIVISRAVNCSLSQYLEEKLWKKIDADQDAFWSVDKENKIEKVFCCLNATTRDFAKFGRLYLNKGNWNGAQIITKDWINYSLSSDTTGGKSFGYNASWYIGLKEYGDFMAIGLYKQFIYIHPGKKIIIVMFADREKKVFEERVNYVQIFRQLVDQL